MTTRTLLTRTLLTHALLAASLTLPTAFASAGPRPAPVPNPAPATDEGPRPGGPRPGANPGNQDRQQIEAQPLTIGEPIVGGLNNRDHTTADGTHVDHYHVQLTEGQPYHFSIVGQGYSANVEVLNADGSELVGTKSYTDDGLFIIYTAQTAVYTVAVSTQSADDSGRYILHAVVGGEDLPPRENQTGDVAVRDSTEPFTGELNDQSETSAQGRYFNYSIVELEAGTEYCLYAQSPDDGVFVDIVSIDNNRVEFLAIEQDGAYIRVTPTVSGPHALSTIAKRTNHTTSYTGYAWVPNTGSSQTIVDSLSAESVLLDNGCYFDFHAVELVADTTYVIDVTSDAFDTIAYLFDADDNQLAENDHAADTGSNAQITFTPETSGTYSVGVSSNTARATGGYMVRVASGDRIGQDSGVSITRGDDEDEDMRGLADHPIVGQWQITRVQQGDQQQDAPPGAVVYELDADGNTAYYEQGKLIDRGTYTIDGDQMTMTNSEGIDETSTVRIDGDTLTVQVQAENGQVMTLTLERSDADAPAPQANTDPAIHGRWNATTVHANNADNKIPANALVFEFLPDGTFNSYANGQVTGTGTYTTEDGALDITTGGATENNTYTIQRNSLSINTIIPPNTPAVITLEKAE